MVLTDFGLSRYKRTEPEEKYTKNVATRWYRPPEVLFGGQDYNENIDIWALGCILAELITRTPLFKGDGDIDQLSKVFEIMGNINVKIDPLLEHKLMFYSLRSIQRLRTFLITLNLNQ